MEDLSNFLKLVADPRSAAKLLEAATKHEVAKATAEKEMADVKAGRAELRVARDALDVDRALFEKEKMAHAKDKADVNAAAADLGTKQIWLHQERREFDARLHDVVTREGALQERDTKLQARAAELEKKEAEVNRKIAAVKALA